MSIVTKLGFLPFVLCVIACNTTQDLPVQPVGVPVARLVDNRSSPVHAVFEGPIVTEANQIIRLRLHLRVNVLNVPVHLHLEMPHGVTLVNGSQDIDLAPNTVAHEETLRYDILYHTLPTTDVVMQIDSRSLNFGYHGSVAYRFGRPEPTVTQPTYAPQVIKIGSRMFRRIVVVQ